MGNILFGKKFEVGRLNFQGSFDHLCSQLPSSLTPEIFLYSHTIYPLFIPFISKEKQLRAMELFKGDYPDKMQKCLKISEVTNKRTYIRVCKECIKEDFKIYGEPYYRRAHEICLNYMCDKHRIPLYEYEIFPYNIPCRYIDYANILCNTKPIDIPDKFKDKFLALADDIHYIFSNKLDGWDIEKTKYKICNRINERGYVTINNIVHQKKISEDFKLYYSEEFLKYIGLNFDINDNDSWIRHCTNRRKSIANPLKFLLVIRFLFGSFENLYTYDNEYQCFKLSPYPCLNVVCPNYKKLVITDILHKGISHSHPLAIFKCDHCGFTYSRRGPDKDAADIYKKTYVC